MLVVLAVHQVAASPADDPYVSIYSHKLHGHTISAFLVQRLKSLQQISNF